MSVSSYRFDSVRGRRFTYLYRRDKPPLAPAGHHAGCNAPAGAA